MMSKAVANYRDPKPDPKKMGWGDPRLQAEQNRVIERKHQDRLTNRVMARDAAGAGAMLPKIEKAIRAKFKFDAGWDCMVAERMVYGLADNETLMIVQNMGNCVGDSHCCVLASRTAHEILAIGDAEEPLGRGQLAVPFIPYSYGAGRLVGGMLGPGDGSYCGAQIKGSEEYGFLPCSTPGLDAYSGDLPQCSSSVGRKFGSSKAEILKWADKAKVFDLEEAPVCKTADESWSLVVDKQIPLQICSGTMPTFWKDDPKYGIPLYRMGEPASHSTQIVGEFELKGARFVIGRNQWGYGAHKGAPTIGIPGGCYVFPIEELAKWLPRAECIGIGSIKGLPSNPQF